MVTYFPQEIIYFLLKRRNKDMIRWINKNSYAFIPRLVEEGAFSIFEELIDIYKVGNFKKEPGWDIKSISKIINSHSRLKLPTGKSSVDLGRKKIFNLLDQEMENL
jgi:hypothetical protein